MAESTLSPSTSGSVVLDLGPGTGALVLHTPPELDVIWRDAGTPAAVVTVVGGSVTKARWPG